MSPDVGNRIAVQTEKLSRTFDGRSGREPILAVDAVTLEVYRGEVFGLLGHNGAGKTTTVRLLNGVLAPTDGTLLVLGYDPAKEGTALRRRTGVLTETPSLDEKLNAQEQLTIYGRLYGVAEDGLQHRVIELLKMFDLAERSTELVGRYSKGMKQRLALARALLHDPELVFLDEPTAGLDPVAAREVHQLITRLSQARGRTVILCTHNLMEAQRLCHRVAVMEHGSLLAVGAPAELADELWQGVRLEVELDHWTADAISLVPEARDLAWHPQDSTLEVSIPHRDVIPRLVTALVHNGFQIYRVEPQEPTLEDVYFALHDGRAREEMT